MADKSSKNQTSQERARRRAAEANNPTRHRCVGPCVPGIESPIITKGELLPVQFYPGKQMRFYHKACLSLR